MKDHGEVVAVADIVLGMLPLATTVENRIGDAASRRRCRQI
jgi:hypothetical protein